MEDFKVKVDTSELDITLNKVKELNTYLKETISYLYEMRSYGVSKKLITRLVKSRLKVLAIATKKQKSTKK